MKRRRKPPPIVFVSYSYDSPSHIRWIVKVSTLLRRKGVDVILDKWDLPLGGDLAKFMENGVRRADKVLAICSEPYVLKFDARRGGVGYEATIVTGDLIRSVGPAKFIPIVRQRGGRADLPAALRTRRYLDASGRSSLDELVDVLVRELYGRPEHPKPPLGEYPFR